MPSPSDPNPVGGPPSRAPERSSSWVLMARVKLLVLSGVAAREAEGPASGEDRNRLGWLSLRLRMSELYRSRVALVGEANEGRLGDEAGRGRASRGVVDSGSGWGWRATAVRGDVRRLLGAEVSIAWQLGFWLHGHGLGRLGREMLASDALKRGFVRLRVRAWMGINGGDHCFVWRATSQGTGAAMARTVRQPELTAEHTAAPPLLPANALGFREMAQLTSLPQVICIILIHAIATEFELLLHPLSMPDRSWEWSRVWPSLRPRLCP